MPSEHLLAVLWGVTLGCCEPSLQTGGRAVRTLLLPSQAHCTRHAYPRGALGKSLRLLAHLPPHLWYGLVLPASRGGGRTNCENCDKGLGTGPGRSRRSISVRPPGTLGSALLLGSAAPFRVSASETQDPGSSWLIGCGWQGGETMERSADWYFAGVTGPRRPRGAWHTLPPRVPSDARPGHVLGSSG